MRRLSVIKRDLVKKEASQNLEQQRQQRQAATGACILCTLSCDKRMGTPCMYKGRVSSVLSCLRLSVTPRTVARQVPLSMGFPRQEYWSGLPFPSPGDLAHSGIEPTSLETPALAGRDLGESQVFHEQLEMMPLKLFRQPVPFCPKTASVVPKWNYARSLPPRQQPAIRNPLPSVSRPQLTLQEITGER